MERLLSEFGLVRVLPQKNWPQKAQHLSSLQSGNWLVPPQTLVVKDDDQTPTTSPDSSTIGLNASQCSLATLPATDPTGTETPSHRSRYTVLDPVTQVATPAPAQPGSQGDEAFSSSSYQTNIQSKIQDAMNDNKSKTSSFTSARGSGR